ncbi:hypothetical protein [uncultured Chryseobacterium sp.]|uniref:hypothetical protein n=3 Tax=uncultured Chryseobacterium sp. TaxID=259322 RepID=UPI0025F37402|nr:hypothetical protein [uncultured Chryseobacterium sp.]
METPYHNSDIRFNEDLDTIEWIDIENAELDSYNYLNDIENFFQQDFENNMSEEKVFWSKLPAPQLPGNYNLLHSLNDHSQNTDSRSRFSMHSLHPVTES